MEEVASTSPISSQPAGPSPTPSVRLKAGCKYSLQRVAEERFSGIIFDVAISPGGDVFVSCCEGIFICGRDLKRKTKLTQIILPGGIAFMPDERIVVICRNQDTVNFFSKDGIFIKSFRAGFSPMGLVVNSNSELYVSDPGKKVVHVFNTKGEKVDEVGERSTQHRFQWPMYMTKLPDTDHLVVCDCHAQTVLQFDGARQWHSCFKLKTSSTSEVLRPHGIACSDTGDLFVVDTSLDTVEVFTCRDTFVQTLVASDEGHHLKPKCIAVSPQGLCVIGGRLGVVQAFELISVKEETPVKTEIDLTAASSSSSSNRVFDCVKTESSSSGVKRKLSKDLSNDAFEFTPSSECSSISAVDAVKSESQDTKPSSFAATGSLFAPDAKFKKLIHCDDDDDVSNNLGYDSELAAILLSGDERSVKADHVTSDGRSSSSPSSSATESCHSRPQSASEQSDVIVLE